MQVPYIATTKIMIQICRAEDGESYQVRVLVVSDSLYYSHRNNRSMLIYETLRGSGYNVGPALHRANSDFTGEEASKFFCTRRRVLIRTPF